MCYQVLNLTHTSLVTQPRQSTLHSYPCCLAWCGSATPRERHCRTWATALPWLKWPLGIGDIYTFPPSSPMSLFLPQLFSSWENRKVLFSLSPPLVTLSSQASPLIFPSIIERKRCQTQLESRSTDFQTLKSIQFTFWLAVVFVTLGAWLLAG